jgi:transposase
MICPVKMGIMDTREVIPMRQTKLLQEIRIMRFEEAFYDWRSNKINQEEAARLLGVCERTFRRYINRYEEEGLDGLIDKRLSQVSHRRAPVDEVMKVTELYRNRYEGFNVKHFYSFYKNHHNGSRSYTWVKNTLQTNKLVQKTSKRGKHRKRRPRAPYQGMMLHQDGSTHEWVEGKQWDLIITLDDATSEHYSMFFVDEEGTASSFQGVRDVIEKKGLFASFYTDRGSHYWYTPEAGGKVDKVRLTQFGRAMRQLGITMIPAYSPEARGRCERMFSTHQERLTKELKLAGITKMSAANAYLKDVYLPAFNFEFTVPAREDGSAFVKWIGGNVDDILCEQYDRTVTNDNCVSFDGMSLQIPKNKYRFHYVKVKVRVHKYLNSRMAVFHGPKKLSVYDEKGNFIKEQNVASVA